MNDLVLAKQAFATHCAEQIRSVSDRITKMIGERHFTSDPAFNVVGVGIGKKISQGKLTDRMCVKVLVAKKFSKSQVPRKHFIQKTIDGLPTDITQVGYVRRLQNIRRTRVRPVQPGTSVSHNLNFGYIYAGTFGIIVSKKRSKTRYILSNNHVLADENKVKLGSKIIQPGSLDNGVSNDGIATLTKYRKLYFNNKKNWHDSAIAEISKSKKYSTDIIGIGKPRSAGTPKLHANVSKSGRTTGLTHGSIIGLKVDLFSVEFDSGFVRMEDVIEIEGFDGLFSDAGDSGSAIINERFRAVGLLFAGGDESTFAIPMQRVLRYYKMRIHA